MSFFVELKRRNVFKVGIAYIVASWLLLQLTEVLVELLDLPDVAGRFVILILIIGFIVAGMVKGGVRKAVERSSRMDATLAGFFSSIALSHSRRFE